MAAHGQTRQRIVATAAELFRRQGMHATGMNQILREGNAPKGSLYFHFPGGKNQLAAEAVAASAAVMAERLRALLDPSVPVADSVAAMLSELATGLTDSDFTAGCPIATVALEADSPQVNESCRAGYDSWSAIIADWLGGVGVPEAETAELATTVLATVEGALLLACTARDTAPLMTVGRALTRLVTLAVPA